MSWNRVAGMGFADFSLDGGMKAWTSGFANDNVVHNPHHASCETCSKTLAAYIFKSCMSSRATPDLSPV